MNDNQKTDYCNGNIYYDFLDYAFQRTDYFMLVYVNYYGKGYSKVMKQFRNALKTFEIKSRSNARWPGTIGTLCANTSYKVIFYKNDERAKEILKEVNCISQWSGPLYPQDLAFFSGNQCWFYSVGHEKIAAIIHASKQDLEFVEGKGLAMQKDAYNATDDYFDAYDEKLN